MNVAFMTPLKYRICSIIFPLAKKNKLPKGTKTSNQNQPCLTSICTRACVLPCQNVWKQNHMRNSLHHVHFYIITFNREPAFLLEAQTIVPKCNDRDWKTMLCLVTRPYIYIEKNMRNMALLSATEDHSIFGR